MKILIADPISPKGVEYLKSQTGLEVVEAYGSSQEEIIKITEDAAGIIVRSETKITKDLIEAASQLQIVGRAGVGVDNIDIEAATDRGIVVMNTPSGNTIATAELTFAHILASTRPIPQAHALIKAGGWDRKAFGGSELYGKTLGILGLGRIGTEVSKRAQAFGMHVLAHDPFLMPERAKDLGIDLATLDRIYAESDYITIHIPLTERTKHLINAEAFKKMKRGVRIFNCARGGIIDEAALLNAVKSGHVQRAGLDVFEEEPLAKDSPLRSEDNIVLTPHLGASTEEAQESVGIEIAESVTDFFKKGIIKSAVNTGSLDAKTLQFMRPYLKLGEGLGTITQQIGPGPMESVHITYWGKIIDFDTMPLTRSILKGYLRKILGRNINDINSPNKVKDLGINVETTKSTSDANFTDLIEVKAVDAEGQAYTVQGTLFGKADEPRIVFMNGHHIEASLGGRLLVLHNRDFPGMVGVMGKILGDDGVNIANMTLSRNQQGDTALTVYELDDLPSPHAIDTIKENPDITDVKMVDI